MAQDLTYDVLVVGTGSAAMHAAVSAQEFGVKIGVIEKAPREERGGNSMFTGGMRFAYDSVEDLIPLLVNPSRSEIESMEAALPHRTQAELWDELMDANQGKSDQELLQVHVSQSLETVKWARGKGHPWVPAAHGATNGGNVVSINGGTAGLLEFYYTLLEKAGVAFHYETTAVALLRNDKGVINGVRALGPQGDVNFHAKAVILASGGFQANPAMRAAYLGRPWETVKLRGVPYNTGDGLRMAMDVGAWPYGMWSNCHASPNDMNMPMWALPSQRRSGRLGRRERYAYPYSIMVNIHGQRFVDEAWAQRGVTYGQMGQHIMRQPMSIGFQIFDAKARRMDLLDSYDNATGDKANTLGELAQKLGIDPAGLYKTVGDFNAAIQPGELNAQPWRPDHKHTAGLAINKSNYAISIEEPPFEGFGVTCGMTFTWGGLKVDPKTSQVIHVSGQPIPGLYTCGEMLGGLWMFGYGSGSGIMAGATFGRIAGRSAAKVAQGEA